MAGPTTIIIWSVYIGVFFFFLRKTKYIKLGECGRLGVNLGGVRGRSERGIWSKCMYEILKNEWNYYIFILWEFHTAYICHSLSPTSQLLPTHLILCFFLSKTKAKGKATEEHRVWFVLANYSYAWGLAWSMGDTQCHSFKESRFSFSKNHHLWIAHWLGVGLCAQCPSFVLRFYLVWGCAGLAHADTIFMSSYVHLPCCVWEMLFPENNPAPLALPSSSVAVKGHHAQGNS